MMVNEKHNTTWIVPNNVYREMLNEKMNKFKVVKKQIKLIEKWSNP